MAEKVFWSEAEKRTLARHALDIQKERPDLGGLALIQAAIRRLPKNRQRPVRSLSQVEWWDSVLNIEAKLRQAEAAAEGGDKLAILDKTRANTLTTAEALVHLDRFHSEWREEQAASSDERNELLASIKLTLEAIRSDQMTHQVVLREMLQELVILKNVAFTGSVRKKAPSIEKCEECEDLKLKESVHA